MNLTEANDVTNYEQIELIQNKNEQIFENHFIDSKMREKNETFEGRYLLKGSNQTRIKPIRNKKKSLNLNFIQAITYRKNCTNQICFPSLGNILIGRSNFLYASSTCGLEIAERFCSIGQLNETYFDFVDRTFI